MTVTEPLPAGTFGKADWVDYTNYWREADAEWIQSRIILRYATAGDRTTQLGATPSFGTVTYREDSLGANLDRLEMYSKQHNTWVPLLMLANITSTQDNASGVALSHKLAGGKGVNFQPAQTLMDNPVNIMGGTLVTDATGVTIRVGSNKVVKLTTNATSLVSDSPVSATALSTAGALSAASGTFSGTLTAPNINMSGILQGGTFKGAVQATTLTANSAQIGACQISADGTIWPNAGVVAQGSYMTGDGGAGYYRFRNPGNGAVSSQMMTVDASYIRFRATNGMPVDRTDGNHTGGWVGVVFTSDPGAANAPNGSILLT